VTYAPCCEQKLRQGAQEYQRSVQFRSQTHARPTQAGLFNVWQISALPGQVDPFLAALQITAVMASVTAVNIVILRQVPWARLTALSRGCGALVHASRQS